MCLSLCPPVRIPYFFEHAPMIDVEGHTRYKIVADDIRTTHSTFTDLIYCLYTYRFFRDRPHEPKERVSRTPQLRSLQGKMRTYATHHAFIKNLKDPLYIPSVSCV